MTGKSWNFSNGWIHKQNDHSLLWRYPTELIPNLQTPVSNKNSSWQFPLSQHIPDYNWRMTQKCIIFQHLYNSVNQQIN